MTIQIILAPDLQISADDFADTWNADPARRELAEADVVVSKSVQFDPSLVDVGMILLQGVGLGVAANALYDLIKDVLRVNGVRKRTRIEQIRHRDGTEQLIITIEEE
jgi:hypothetical protein